MIWGPRQKTGHHPRACPEDLLIVRSGRGCRWTKRVDGLALAESSVDPRDKLEDGRLREELVMPVE